MYKGTIYVQGRVGIKVVTVFTSESEYRVLEGIRQFYEQLSPPVTFPDEQLDPNSDRGAGDNSMTGSLQRTRDKLYKEGKLERGSRQGSNVVNKNKTTILAYDKEKGQAVAIEGKTPAKTITWEMAMLNWCTSSRNTSGYLYYVIDLDSPIVVNMDKLNSKQKKKIMPKQDKLRPTRFKG